MCITPGKNCSIGKRKEILLAPREVSQEQITIVQLKNGRVTQAERRREKPPSLQSNYQHLQPWDSARQKERTSVRLHSFSPGFVPPRPVSVSDLKGNSHSAESGQLEHKACKWVSLCITEHLIS